MNKKGLVSNYLFGSMGILILTLVLINLVAIEESDRSKEEVYKSLNWTKYQISISEDNNPIANVVFTFVNAAGYSIMEMGKLGIEWGTENIDIKATTLLLLLIFSLVSPILLALIKLGLIITIFIRDIRASRREKKELMELKHFKNNTKPLRKHSKSKILKNKD